MTRTLSAAIGVVCFTAASASGPGMLPASIDPGPATACPPQVTMAPPADTRPRFWGSEEFLLWWIKDAPLSTPLVTTGPVVGNLQPVLGQPGTAVLIGGSDIDGGTRSGARFTIGGWLNRERSLGLEGTYFFLWNRTLDQTVSASGAADAAFLALPFIDATVPSESSTRIALPGGFAGTASLITNSRLQGWELTGVADVSRTPCRRLEVLSGFRYWNLNEDTTLFTNSPSVVGPSDVFITRDQFATGNYFYGGQVGLRGERDFGRWFVQGTGKVALGTMHETVNINGALVTNDFNNLGAPQVFPGGYLALPTNIGRQTRDRFAVIPEVNLTAGVWITDRLRATAGYTFQYVSDVVRPGDQIDRGINPVQAPAITGVPNAPLVGPARPTPLFNTTDFWAHGLSFGLEVRY
ncbi:MAG TPA: BBP7 family outer membrane beta-barrel protein [Gemmataceae bacterium]|nr:BBP7 family outer membrane beta-barrel protein [Gemmataceae bacterium]